MHYDLLYFDVYYIKYKLDFLDEIIFSNPYSKGLSS